jgi:hypothetical protein
MLINPPPPTWQSCHDLKRNTIPILKQCSSCSKQTSALEQIVDTVHQDRCHPYKPKQSCYTGTHFPWSHASVEGFDKCKVNQLKISPNPPKHHPNPDRRTSSS